VSPHVPVWRRSTFWFGLVVLVPIFAWYAVFALWPIVGAFWISLHRYNALNPELGRFVGLRNYLELPGDERFRAALANSFLYMLAKNLMALPVALLLAVLLEKVRRRQFYLFAYFLPVVMSLIGTVVLFIWLYDPVVGLLNGLLQAVGLPPQKFLRSESQALVSIAGMDAWKSFGFYTIVFLAGLLNIPEILYDAARVDGADGWRSFWHVTLPLLSRTLALVLVIAAIDGFQVFAAPYIMGDHRGGPGRSTLVLSMLVYLEGLANLNLGYAASVSFVLFVIVIAIAIVQLRLLRRSADY